MTTKFKQASLVLVGVLAGILLSLNFSAVAQRESARFPLPVDELRAFAEVFGAIKSNYVEPVEDKKLITEAISGMLTGLDPHSAYLDQDAFKELQVGTQGEFGGLGIEVGMEEGFVKVVSPIEDTPAFRAGLKPGDFIIKIDDTSVKGMTLNDAVKRMRGKPKTTIRLTIMRKGDEIQADRTRIRLDPRFAIPGAHGREPGETPRGPVQEWPAERPDPGPAQRSRRFAQRRRGHFGRIPARTRSGGLDRRPDRGRQTQVHRGS
jgi:C-terminal processing protease CtpA/Prc